MKKKIVFFDATGTLWYPKITKNDVDPGWVYKDKNTKYNLNEHLIMSHGAKDTLRHLNKIGIKCIVVSAVPYPLYKFKIELKKTIEHFGVSSLISEYHAVNMIDGSSKAKVILKVLKKYDVKKKEAVMVGDGYWQDYKFVRKVGVPALLVNSSYQNSRAWQIRKAKHRIYTIRDVIKYLK